MLKSWVDRLRVGTSWAAQWTGPSVPLRWYARLRCRVSTVLIDSESYWMWRLHHPLIPSRAWGWCLVVWLKVIADGSSVWAPASRSLEPLRHWLSLETGQVELDPEVSVVYPW